MLIREYHFYWIQNVYFKELLADMRFVKDLFFLYSGPYSNAKTSANSKLVNTFV